MIEQIEEFEKRLLHLDEVQTFVEAKIELEGDIETAAEFRDDKTKVLIEARERLRCLTKEHQTRDSSDSVSEALPAATPHEVTQQDYQNYNCPSSVATILSGRRFGTSFGQSSMSLRF